MKLSEFFKHDFKTGEFNLSDKNGRLMYRELPPDKKDPDGFWAKYIRREDGLCTYMEWSNGYWAKSEYNESGQHISKDCSDGYWWIQEFDSDGNETVYTCSDDSFCNEAPKFKKGAFDVPKESIKGELSRCKKLR